MSLKIWVQKVYNSSSSNNNTIGSLEEDLTECICRTNYRGSHQYRVIKYTGYNNEGRFMLNVLDEIKEEDDVDEDEDAFIPLMNYPIVYYLASGIMGDEVLEVTLYELDDDIPNNRYYLSDV